MREAYVNGAVGSYRQELVRQADAAIAKAEHTTITDEPTGTDAPNQGDDHAE
jgi:hypothetical protein